MARLDVTKITHERDENGELIPIEISLDLLAEEGKETPTILATPLSRGEIKKMFKGLKGETTKDQDDEIIKKHLKDPVIPEAQVKDMRLKYANAIVTAIISLSIEIPQNKLEKAGKEAIKNKINRLDQEVKKN